MKRMLSARRAPAVSIAPLFSRQFAQQRPPAPAIHMAISSKDKLFLAALQRFHELNGHFLVPSHFVVPSDEDAEEIETSARATASSPAAWPRETWGLELGKRLRTFTRGRGTQFKTTMLQSIGFPHQDWRAYVWVEQTLPAMRAFKRIHGHLFVRQGFQVPTESDGSVANRWPRATWGLKFGAQCQQLRAGRSNHTLSREQVEELDRIGFMWSDAQWKWECQLLPALTRFRKLFGHVQVPLRFSVPENDHRWPRTIWGYKLGVLAARALDDVKILEPPHDERAMKALQDLDFFSENAADEAWRDRILPCLEVYSSLYRRGLLNDSLDGVVALDSRSTSADVVDGEPDFANSDREVAAIVIPKDFVVPSDSRWPAQAWMLPLGYIVNCICSSVLFDAQVRAHKHQLQRLGYGWDALYSKWARELLPALIAFQREHGHCDVPLNYVVPLEAAAPTSSATTSTTGYRLGKQVAALRRAGRDASDVTDILDQLDAIGFQFDAHESTFVARVLPALRAYVDKYGDCNVSQGFIVPSDDDAWPASTRGMKLGHTVRDMRSRHHYGGQSDAYQNELKALGFSWKLHRPRATAVSIDVVLDYWGIYQSIYGTEYVPTDFVVPGDDPRWSREARHFGLGAWLQAYRQRLARAQLTTQRPVRRVLRLEQTSTDAEDAVSGDSSGVGSAADTNDDDDASLHDIKSEMDEDDDEADDILVLKSSSSPVALPSSPLRGSRRARRAPPTNAPELPQYQEEYWADVVLASFRAYASLHGGSCSDMDPGYIVPSEGPFPAVAWGLNLGLRLWHVKYGDRYAVEVRKYEEELRALGITVEKTKTTRAKAEKGKEDAGGEDDHSEAV